jgi:hypothetical protein
MERKNVIILTTPKVECFGNFKKMCEIKDLPYHSLKVMKFPIIYKEYTILKVQKQ